jgi:hypothetical protein
MEPRTQAGGRCPGTGALREERGAGTQGGSVKITMRQLKFSLAVILACAGSLPAQSLVSEALSSFPKDTIRVEYSRPSVLRTLPDYAAMRQRYEGPRLQELEGSFSKLGIQESDVDELVLGWRVHGQEWLLYGITSGRFNAQTLAERAGSEGLAPSKLGDQIAYCSGTGGSANCLLVLGDSLGAFGTLASLNSILEARAGRAPSLASDARFSKLLQRAETTSPIWGAAVGPAVPDWYKGWMPNQNNLQLDWSKAFKPVESLTYSVDPGETVRLNIAMDCDTQANAASLKQVFDGLKLFQQLSWQNQNPGRANPYKNVEIRDSDTQVLIKLETDYGELRAVGAPGTAQN